MPLGRPVSYTHLDVYKRQTASCSFGFQKLARRLVSVGVPAVLVVASSVSSVLVQHVHVSVSYTHLDVYKRQPRGLSDTDPTLGPSGRQERLNCC